MNQLSLALDPKLGLSADELVTAWNADPDLRSKAAANHERPALGTLLDPLLAHGLVSLAVSVAGGLTTNLILDFLRGRLKAKGQENPAVEIEQRELPTGERLLIARVGQGRSAG
jgi:hypothetical protein